MLNIIIKEKQKKGEMQMMKTLKKSNKGITLIALAISTKCVQYI